MTFKHFAQLAGVALLVMAANVLCTFLYMVVYSYLINPGHDAPVYQAHVQIAAPYCSVVAGIPLMFLAGWWVAGWKGSNPAVTAALVVWAVYALVDFSILVASGSIGQIALLFAASFVTKLVAIYFGAVVRRRGAGLRGAVA
ncbi:MAG: hypothetical protein ABI587_15075 [Gemmatimonadales bacterium]